VKRLTIIDLDSIIYVVAYQERDAGNDYFSELTVRGKVESFIEDIVEETSAECLLGFYQLQGHKNFRYAVHPEYKAKRPEAPDFIKKWRPIIHDTFANTPGVFGLKVIESDDAMSIAAREYRGDYFITLAHIDKDLDSIYGLHYNYNKKKFYEKTAEESEFFFKCQVLAGDVSTDNIPGVPGIGLKTAAKYVNLADSVVIAYKIASIKKKVETWRRNFYRDYHCIRLLHDIEELKQFSDIKEVEYRPHCYDLTVEVPIAGW